MWWYIGSGAWSMKNCLQKPSQPCSDALLSLDELHLLWSFIQLIQGVRITFLVEIVLNLAESLTELAAQYLHGRIQQCLKIKNEKSCLVVQDVLEVFPHGSSFELEWTTQLTILGDSRVMLELLFFYRASVTYIIFTSYIFLPVRRNHHLRLARRSLQVLSTSTWEWIHSLQMKSVRENSHFVAKGLVRASSIL